MERRIKTTIWTMSLVTTEFVAFIVARLAQTVSFVNIFMLDNYSV